MDITKKFFVSYKYKDGNVFSLDEFTPDEDTEYLHTPKHYVDKIIQIVGAEHIYKGEKGDESMDDLVDDTIDSKLREKIFDSSVTIVLISPNMKELWLSEEEQWIPREIAYSLRNKTRGNRTSKTNAMLAVALPDSNGSYDYAVQDRNCVTVWQTNSYFNILNKNMFNRNNKNLIKCDICGSYHHQGGDHSYIHPVKWDYFINNHNTCIEHVLRLRDNLDDFSITKDHE